MNIKVNVKKWYKKMGITYGPEEDICNRALKVVSVPFTYIFCKLGFSPNTITLLSVVDYILSQHYAQFLLRKNFSKS